MDTEILPVVLPNCKTWSVILKYKHRLRVFKNGVLRKRFRPERLKVTGLEKTA